MVLSATVTDSEMSSKGMGQQPFEVCNASETCSDKSSSAHIALVTVLTVRGFCLMELTS